jgi:KUP system potassium uptake protein
MLCGYMDDIITADLAKLLVDQITLFITSDLAEANGSGSLNHSKDDGIANRGREIRAELAALQHAESQQTVYIVSKEQMRIRHGTNIHRRILLGVFLWIRENARSNIVGLNIPMEQLVEVGFVKDI